MPNGAGALMLHQHHQRGAVFEGCSGYAGPTGRGVVRSVLSRLTAAGVQTVGELPFAVLPVDVAVSASGNLVALAVTGSATALVHSAQTGWITVFLPGQPTSVAAAGERFWVAVREPATLVRLDPGQPPQSIALSGDSAESTGHTLFHRAALNGVACASCHPEAGEDGHTWLQPEGGHRTASLRGGLAGTAPFHWRGEFLTLEPLLSEVLVLRMRGNVQSPERAQALLAWLDAQPALPGPSWLAPDVVERGRALFEGKAGCVSCHAGPQGTNNATVEVGIDASLQLQVPRLVELARRAPYFHDGRIPTLAALFGPAQHGNVSALSAAELEELTTYLASR